MRAPPVVQADHRHAVLHGEIHDLADLFGMRLGERTAEDGEVLGEDVSGPAIDRAPAGHDAIARKLLGLHAEIGAAMRLVHVVFLEGAFIQQHIQPLARRQLALAMLRIDPLLAAAETGFRAPRFELFKDVLHGRLSLPFRRRHPGLEPGSSQPASAG